MIATISRCGRYRYNLSRLVGQGKDARTLAIVMLNPSTADAMQDDPTIRRCVSFARRQKFSGIVVVNLFAYRATKPADLWLAEDPVGENNDLYIQGAVSMSSQVLVAWGAHGDRPAARARIRKVADLLRFARSEVYCLGTTASGQPLHPLMQPNSAPWMPYVLPSAKA